MLTEVHLLALRIYRRMPTLLRRWIVRLLAPSYTVGAICLIERADGHVLLIRHSYRARWGLPGGLLTRRELPKAAAHREVWEEVGLDIELEGEPAVVVDPGPQRIDLVFRARPAAGVDPVTAHPRSPEIAEVRWFARDELPELQPETATALVALARSARAPQAVPIPVAGLLDRRYN